MPLGAARLNFLSKAITAEAVANGAVTFDGTNDYYEATSISTKQYDSPYLTFGITFYRGSSTNLQHLFNLRLGTGGSDYGFWVWINGGRTQVKMVTGTGSNPTSIYEVTENSLTLNDWNQIVVWWNTDDYANSKIYVNGADKSITNEGTTAVDWNWGNTATTLKIGEANSSQTGSGADFNGKIAQLYISDYHITPDINKFWDAGNSRPYDLGAYGTSTGLPKPLIYHYGDTTTFPTNRGVIDDYTLTANGDIGSDAPTTYTETFPDAYWGSFATTFNGRYEPTSPPTISRDHTLFNCGNDKFFYVYGGQESGNTHFIYRFSANTATSALTYDTRVDYTSTPDNISLLYLGSIGFPGRDAALVINGLYYRYITQAADGSLTIQTVGTISNARRTTQFYLNPDDDTQLIFADDTGNFSIFTIDHDAYTITQDSTVSTGVAGETNGQGFIIDDGGVAKFAYAFVASSTARVFRMDFDGTNTSNITLSSAPSGDLTAYKRTEAVISNGVAIPVESNGTTGSIFSIVWDPSTSTFTQGSTVTMTPTYPASTNNIRVSLGSQFLQEDDTYIYHAVLLHLAANAAGGVPRSEIVAVYETTKSTGATAIQGGWMQVSDVASTAGNVRRGCVVSQNRKFFITSGDSDGSGVSDGVPELIWTYS